jgi:antitoxin Phd
MRVYTYSEARQKLAAVLDEAQRSGKVLIRRKDGTSFALTPEPATESPLDVEGIATDISLEEIIECLREVRSRGLE